MTHHARSRFLWAVGVLLALALSSPTAGAQGVTTGSMTGIVQDSQGGVTPGVTVTAVHQPSGTTYEAVTQGDGRFFLRDLRVGGPYQVTAMLSGFRPETENDITVSLG